MSPFVDRLLLQLSDPAQLAALLLPIADDPLKTRIRTLFDSVYDLPFARLHDVNAVQVRQLEFERPLFPPRRTRQTRTQTVPSHAVTEVAGESTEGLSPAWLDIAAEVGLTLVLEVDPGEVETVLVREITGFNTLDEFRARFRFLDLNAFMAEHHISTFEELRDRFHYLLTQIRLRAPGLFDPADPANQHPFSLKVAILIRDALDLAGALRDAKLARTAAERALTFQREVGPAEVRTPYAPLVIFPEAALAAPFTADNVRAFFARERILALFVTPA